MKNGENIFKRKDGRWEARYIKGYELSGKIKYGFCYGKTYKEAKEKVTKHKAALLAEKPTPQTGKRHRFAFYCDEWLRLRKSKIPHQHHQHGYSLFCVRQQRGGLKDLSASHRLDPDTMYEVMEKPKANQRETVKLDADTLRRFFPDYTPKQMETAILRMLEEAERERQRQKILRRSRDDAR